MSLAAAHPVLSSLTSDAAVKAAAQAIHEHRFGARDTSATSWAVASRAASLAIAAAVATLPTTEGASDD